MQTNHPDFKSKVTNKPRRPGTMLGSMKYDTNEKTEKVVVGT